MNRLPFDRSSFNPRKDRHQVLRGEMERLNGLGRHVRVLEWGSGLSTVLLAENLTDNSSVISIEHDPHYLFDIPERYSRNVRQVHLPAQKPFGQSSDYVTYPVTDFLKTGEGYDLIIVDGRNRADCLAIAAMLLKPDGAVILCDAERDRYQAHYNLYRNIFIYPEPDSSYQTALLKKPVCSLNAHASLTNGAADAIMPKRKPMPSTWGVCAVALPRESYHWLRDWIDHHANAGASKIAIYDNTGSVKSQRGSSVFSGGRYQREQVSKRGEEYGRLTSHLSDEQISSELRNLAGEYGSLVDIVTWQPLHTKEDMIVHGQVEAYCDFIRRYRDTLGWGLFIDLDEYVYCRPGLSVGTILDTVEKEHPTVSALHLTDWEFECRWGKDGPKDIAKLLVHHHSRHDCGKTFARLQDITHANVHCDWKLKAYCTRIAPNPDDMAFAHYKLLPEELEGCNGHIRPRDFLSTPHDHGIRPKFSTNFHVAYCGAPALPVDTTFVRTR